MLVTTEVVVCAKKPVWLGANYGWNDTVGALLGGNHGWNDAVDALLGGNHGWNDAVCAPRRGNLLIAQGRAKRRPG